MSIRRYKASDQRDVLRLHDLALHAVGAHAGEGPWDNDLRRIEEVYLRAGGEFLVGILEERLVAMGALEHTSAVRARVTRMRVHPDWQRHGFGQAILSALEKRATELGCSQLHLDTTVRQIAAQRLYAKNGYRESHRGEILGFECIFYEKLVAPMEPRL